MNFHTLYVGVDIGGRIGFSPANKNRGNKQPKWITLAQVIGKSKKEFKRIANELKKQFPGKKGWEIIKQNNGPPVCYLILKKSKLYFDVLVYDKTRANQILIKNKQFKKVRTADSPQHLPFRPHYKQVSMPIWDTADEFEKAGFEGKIMFLLDNDFGHKNTPAIQQIKEEMEIRYRGKPKCTIDIGDDKRDPEVYLADIIASLIRKELIEKTRQYEAILNEKITIRKFESIRRELKTKPYKNNHKKIRKFLSAI